MIRKIDVTNGEEKVTILFGPDGVNLIKDGIENWYMGSVTWYSTTRPITWYSTTATSGIPL